MVARIDEAPKNTKRGHRIQIVREVARIETGNTYNIKDVYPHAPFDPDEQQDWVQMVIDQVHTLSGEKDHGSLYT